MIKAIGWLGSIMFALCGAPQAVKSYKDGHSNGLSLSFLGLWTGGEILTTIAVALDTSSSYLLFNYIVNMVFLSVILKYKFKPRSEV